jgi:FtsP/CotA-like multicopper oxidase with cupredoxin domain
VLDLRLDNIDIANGVTVHWHGYPVPWAADGVAGVTQDAVAPGETFRTEFTLDRPGTYWYHTHQLGSEGVVRGLYGTLVVLPAGDGVADLDVALPVHTFGRTVVLGAEVGIRRMRAVEGWTVRARLVNTDQQPQQFTVSGAPFRVVAIDGTDVEAQALSDIGLRIPAGGRYDIEFTMPDSPVVVRAGASETAAIVFAASAEGTLPAARSIRTFDPLTELAGGTAPERIAAALIAHAEASDRFDVDETYVLDRLPRLLHGLPMYAHTVNGAVYPHIPSTIVAEGDSVRLTVVNRSFETHPIHPHGHTVRVLSVDGVAPHAPLWLDTFDVAPGEVWEVAFVADNPGIWMDHCHNLEHAALGMVFHIAYRGMSTSFEPGGEARNAPE